MKPAIKSLQLFCHSFKFNSLGYEKILQERKREENPLKDLELFCHSFEFDDLGAKEKEKQNKQKENPIKGLELFCRSFQFDDLDAKKKIRERKTKREEENRKEKERKLQERRTAQKEKRKEKKKKEYEKRWLEEQQRLRDIEILKKIRRWKLELCASRFLRTGTLPERIECLYPANWSEESKREDKKEYERNERKNEKLREKRKQKKKPNNKKRFCLGKNQCEPRLEKLRVEIVDARWRWKQKLADAKRKKKEALKQGKLFKALFYFDVEDRCKIMERRYERANGAGVLSDEVKDRLDFSPVPESTGNAISDDNKIDLDFLPVNNESADFNHPLLELSCELDEEV